MNKIEGIVSSRDTLVILGEKPPCNPGGRGCQSAMDAFAKKHDMNVKYMTTKDEWKYSGKCPCGDKKPC